MDGGLLVFDSRTLPNLHALAPVAVPVAARAPWRHRTFPAVAALILATVFSLVYFVSAQRGTPSPARVNGAPMLAPISNPVQPADSNTAPPEATPEVSAAAPPKEEIKPETIKAPTASAAAKKPGVRVTTPERKPTEEPKKEDSKVGSILKKTGRILKKPFKF
jgi:hypothetical protein